MKVWYTYEAIAHNEEELEKLKKKYNALYHRYKSTGELNMTKINKIRE